MPHNRNIIEEKRVKTIVQSELFESWGGGDIRDARSILDSLKAQSYQKVKLWPPHQDQIGQALSPTFTQEEERNGLDGR